MGSKASEREERLRMEALVSEFIRGRARETEAKQDRIGNVKVAEHLARQEFMNQRFERIAKRFDTQRSWIPKYKGKTKKHIERKLNLVLSDLHYGSDLDKRLVNFPYFATEEARRTAAVAAQVADYKRQYRSETELEIHLIGDVIQGKLHDVQDAAPLTEQIDRALHSLIHGIEFLASEFPKVTIRTSVGNHGRDPGRHHERAMQGKWDSNEFRLYRAMKYRFAKVPNIVMETPMKSFYIYDQFGQKGVMTHGDTVFQPGYPGKFVDVKRLSTQINDFKLAIRDHFDVTLYCMGHVHTAMDIRIGPNIIVTNGCLVPTDEYAQSIGIFTTPCVQQLWETVRGHQMGDHRCLEVGPNEDADASLDKIVPTWTSLEAA